MEQFFTEFIKAWGAYGAFLAMLVGTIVVLWRELKACRKASDSIISIAERSTGAFNASVAASAALSVLMAELRAVVIAQTNAINQLAESEQMRFAQQQKDSDQLQRHFDRKPP